MDLLKNWLGITSADQNPDYFQLLGIPRETTDKEFIKNAVKRRILQLKPYKLGEHALECEQVFKRLKKAHRVLSDPDQRNKYLDSIADANSRDQQDTIGLADSAGNPRKVAAERTLQPSDSQATSFRTVSPGDNLKLVSALSTRLRSLPLSAIIAGTLSIIILPIGFLYFYFGSGAIGEQPDSKQQVTAARGSRFDAVGPERAQAHADIPQILDWSRPVEGDLPELLDPRLPYRIKAEELIRQQDQSAQIRKVPSARFHSMIELADYWIRAEEHEHALDAITKAEIALSQMSKQRFPAADNEKLGALFLRVSEDEKACRYFLQALKTSSQIADIDRLQKKARQALVDDGLPNISDQDKALLDPSYKYRAFATFLETRSYPTDHDRDLKNLIDAATNWIRAGEMNEALRCAKKAEFVLEDPKLRNHTRTKLLTVLTDFYIENNQHNLAIAIYVEWIKKSQDADAASYLTRIKSICSKTGLAIPEFDAETQVKLDPLNRYRVEAKRYQRLASRLAKPNLGFMIKIAQNWSKAYEPDRALEACEALGKLLQDESTPTREVAVYSEQLAQVYLEINLKELAIKYFNFALNHHDSEFNKDRVRHKLERLQR